MGYIGKSMQNEVNKFGCELEIVKRPRKWFRIPSEITDVKTYLQEHEIDTSDGFKVSPRRWVVERTFAWLGRYRRLSKDYEYLCEVSEAFIFIAMTKTMLKRLGNYHAN